MPNPRISASILQSAVSRDKALGVLDARKERKPSNRHVTAASLTTEAMVAEAGVPWLRFNGWKVHRINADRWEHGNNKAHEQEEPGTPDMLVCRPLIPALPIGPLPGGWHGACDRQAMFRWEAKRTVGGVLRASQKQWAKDNPHQLICYAKSFEELRDWTRVYFPWVKEVCK